MVTAMDDAVGQVVESLKQNNLFDNTIIVFTADVRKSTINLAQVLALNFHYTNVR